MSRFGPIVQIGQPDELEEDEKPKYAICAQVNLLKPSIWKLALGAFQIAKNTWTIRRKRCNRLALEGLVHM